MFLLQAQAKASRQAEGSDQQGDNRIQPPDRHWLLQRLGVSGNRAEIGVDLGDQIADAGLIGDHPFPLVLPLQCGALDRHNGGVFVGYQRGKGGENTLFPFAGQPIPHGEQPGEGDPQVGILNAMRRHPPELPIYADVQRIACGENTSGRPWQGEDRQQAEPDAHQGKIPRPFMPQQSRYPGTEKQHRQPQSLSNSPLQKPGAYPRLAGQEDLHTHRERLGRIAAGLGGPLFQLTELLPMEKQQAPGAESHHQHTCEPEPIAAGHQLRTEQGIPDAYWVTGGGGESKTQMVGKTSPEDHRQKGQQRPCPAVSACKQAPAFYRPERYCCSAQRGGNPARQMCCRQKAVRPQRRSKEGSGQRRGGMG